MAKSRSARTRDAAGGELSLISAIRNRRQLSSSAVSLGIGDDCALIRAGRNEEIAVTTDFSLEHVHFRLDWHPAQSVGHRCLARGLSDLAAMGARPLAAFLSLAVPHQLTVAALAGASRDRPSWVERFLDGLLALAAEWKVPLAGGDTAKSPDGDGPSSRQPGLVTADIVLLGAVARGQALRRSGARAGDLIYVTGALGGAAAELLALERNPRAFRKLLGSEPGHPHLYPEPRLGVGLRLISRRLATAAIDISDGLSTDLRHLCEGSQLTAEIDAAAIPIHPLAKSAGWTGPTGFSPGLALQLALHGGEDYELLFTAPPEKKVPSTLAGVPISSIGRMKSLRRGKPVVALLGSVGRRSIPLEPEGWEHFRRGKPGD